MDGCLIVIVNIGPGYTTIAFSFFPGVGVSLTSFYQGADERRLVRRTDSRVGGHQDLLEFGGSYVLGNALLLMPPSLPLLRLSVCFA